MGRPTNMKKKLDTTIERLEEQVAYLKTLASRLDKPDNINIQFSYELSQLDTGTFANHLRVKERK